MAKAVIRKPKKKVCQFCKEKATCVDYKDTDPAPQVHLRPRQDPRPSGDRQLRPAPARRRHRGQERPRGRPAALHVHGSLRGGRDMKLILTQEVAGLGAPGDVVEVKDGYGRNYLDPARLRDPLDPGGEKTVESIKAARAARAVRDHDHAERDQGQARGRDRSTCKVRAGEGGRLFGAVTVTDIAGAITEPPARRGRQAHDRGRQPDQVAGRARGAGQGARRGVRHGGPQRRPRLTQATPATPERADGQPAVRPFFPFEQFLRCPARVCHCVFS